MATEMRTQADAIEKLELYYHHTILSRGQAKLTIICELYTFFAEINVTSSTYCEIVALEPGRILNTRR